MKKIGLVFMVLAGLFILKQGFDIFTTSSRGEAIYKMGMLIPAQDGPLYTYGAIFMVIGMMLALSPIFFWKLSPKQSTRA